MINISIDEAKNNFLSVIKTVDENGAAIILKDGKQYLVIEYNENKNEENYIDSAKFRDITERVLEKHIEAFRELAK